MGLAPFRAVDLVASQQHGIQIAQLDNQIACNRGQRRNVVIKYRDAMVEISTVCRHDRDLFTRNPRDAYQSGSRRRGEARCAPSGSARTIRRTGFPPRYTFRRIG
jgi:hypothetical protein